MSDERLFQAFTIAPGEGTFGENERLYYEALGRKWGEYLERRFLASLGIPARLINHKQPQPPPKSDNPDRRVPPPPPPPPKKYPPA